MLRGVSACSEVMKSMRPLMPAACMRPRRLFAAEQADRCWAGHPGRLLLAKSVDTDDLVLIAGIAGIGLGGHDLGPGDGALGPRRLKAFVCTRLAWRARLLFELAWCGFDGVGLRGAQRLAGKIGVFELQAVGDARIEEHLDSGERNRQPLWDAVER